AGAAFGGDGGAVARRRHLVHRRARPGRGRGALGLDTAHRTAPCALAQHRLRLALALPFDPGVVARARRVVGGIEAGQRDAALDLAHDPAFEALLLDRGGDDVGDELGGNDAGTVAVGDDDVVGHDGDAAAADRLLPADE